MSGSSDSHGSYQSDEDIFWIQTAHLFCERLGIEPKADALHIVNGISRLTADNEALRAAMDVTQRRAIAAEARADALAQEVERLEAENETYRTAFDGIEPDALGDRP